MKAIDINAVNLGMSTLQLMENAGHAVAETIAACYMEQESAHSSKINVLIFAGLGNNGGDMFVAARHLANLKISEAGDWMPLHIVLLRWIQIITKYPEAKLT